MGPSETIDVCVIGKWQFYIDNLGKEIQNEKIRQPKSVIQDCVYQDKDSTSMI